MAVQRGIGKAQLAAIRQGFVEVKETIARATETTNLRGLIRDLRRIPTSDRDKKRTLAEFFQLPEARHYDADDRRKAYDDVLGRDRNSRQRG